MKVVLEAVKSKYGTFGYIDENGVLVVPSMTTKVSDVCQVPEKGIVFPRDKRGDSTWLRAIRQKEIRRSEGRIIPIFYIDIVHRAKRREQMC